jgi:hypothetical protein
MCTISYSISRWRTAISCGQYRSKHIFVREKKTQSLQGACNRSPGSKLLSITTQLHCGGHPGGRAQLPDTILEEDHPMTIPITLCLSWSVSCRVVISLCLLLSVPCRVVITLCLSWSVSCSHVRLSFLYVCCCLYPVGLSSLCVCLGLWPVGMSSLYVCCCLCPAGLSFLYVCRLCLHGAIILCVIICAL